MRKLTLLFVTVLFSAFAFGQLSGTKNIPGDYATIAAAVTDLNAQGVAAPGVTFNVLAGNPETAPAGGYVIGGAGSLVLTTAINPNTQIIFQGNGNVITASSALTAGALNDAIFKIIGGDYITIDGFQLVENAANTITTAGTNNMNEFGVALFYVTTTDGCQNINILNNIIDLDRTYQNTFGIYVNSTHSSTAMTTSATATGANGGNHNLVITGNDIADVNFGICVVGPTAAADQNNNITIGTLATGNSITNYGTTGTFSGYVNVSGTVNGILVRNSKNFNVVNNMIVSSNGGVTAGTLNGINVTAFSTAPTGTFTNSINNNTISLRSGNAAGNMNGILLAGTTTNNTSTLNIIGNTFSTFGHTVAGTGSITFISNGGVSLNQNINSNVFSNISVNTTGSVTFISNSVSLPVNGVQNVNDNSITTAFSKTGAGGSVTLFTSNASSVAGSTVNNNNNNFSNITITGTTTITGWVNTDGGAPTKTIQGNTFSNWTGGAGSTAISVSWSGNSSVFGNIISNIASDGNVTGITTGSGTDNLFANVINNLSSTGAFTVNGIAVTGGTAKNIYKNNIYNLSNSNVAGFVNGISVTSGTATYIYNNFIADLRTPIANAANPLVGINITGGTNVYAYYNTVFLNASSTGLLFGTSGISASTTPTVDLRNNLIVNNSTPVGATGFTVAYRRSSTTLTSYAAVSNNNDFYAGTPGPNNLIYYDGTNADQDIATFQTRVAPRDVLSFSEVAPFVNIAAPPYNLHLQTTIATKCESGGVRITAPAITDDVDNNTRWGETGYSGTGSTTDVGADEFEGMPSFTCALPTPGNTVASVNPICLGQASFLSLQNVTPGTGVSYQWQSSPDNVTYSNVVGAISPTYSAIPSVPVYYQCIVTCQNGPVTGTSTPVMLTFANSITSTTPATRCGTGSVSLTASGSAGTTLNWYDTSTGGVLVGTGSPFNTPSISSTTTYYVGAETSSPATGTIGTGTSLTSNSGYPTAFGNYWYQDWSQLVYTAAELQAAGLSAGIITSLTFNVGAIASPASVANYTIRIGTSPSSTLSGFTTTGLTTVYGPVATTSVTGLNTITFTTPYAWDGVSNLIVDIRGDGAYGAANATTYYTATAGNTVVYAYSSSNNPSFYTSSPAASTSTSRLNITFAETAICSSPRSAVIATVTTAAPLTVTADQTICNNAIESISVTSNLSDYDSYVWTPITDLYTDAACTIPYSAGLSATTVYVRSINAGVYTYTCTSNNTSTLCSNVATTIVTVLPANPVISASPSILCVSGTSTLDVTPTTGYGTATFQWQNSSDDITFADITGANGISYTTPVINANTYYKLQVLSGVSICSESASALITVTNPQVTATTPGSRCGTGTITLGATESAGATLNWFDVATGGTSLGTGNSFTTPSISTTTDYYVEASQLLSTINEVVGSAVIPSSPSSSSSPDAGIVFTTTVDNVTIPSARILVTGTGNITFELQTSTGSVIASYIAPISGATTAAFTDVNFPATFITGSAGVDYRLLAVAKDAGITWYYPSGTYPYNSPSGSVSITSGWGWGAATATDMRCIHNINVTIDDICRSGRTLVTATVVTAPAVSVTASTNTICEGESVTLDASSSNANYTYTWSPTTTPSTGASVSASPLLTTLYTVTASDNSGGAYDGCVANESVNITVNPLPFGVTATASQSTICEGTVIDLFSTPSSGTVTLIDENFNGATNSWITTNTSTGGTPALAAWTLRPDAYLYSGTTFHSNDNSQFYLSNSDEQGSGGTTATTLESPSFSTLGLTNCSLSFYQYFRSISGSSANVEVFDGSTWTSIGTYTTTQGTAAAFVNTIISLDSYVGLSDVKVRFRYAGSYAWYWAVDNVVVSAVNPPVTYSWTSVPAGFTSTDQNPTGVSPTVNTQFDVVVSTLAGCSSTASANVVVNALPTISLTSPSTVSICEGSSTDIVLAFTGTSPWSFIGDDGSGPTTFPVTTSPFTIPVSPTSTTTYSVISVSDASTCTNTSTLSVVVTVNPIPTATISSSTNPSACGLSDGTATASGGTSYVWDAAAGNQTTDLATGLAAGTYYVTVTDAGCSSTTSVTISDPGAPIVTLTTPNTTVCDGESVTFTAGGADTYEFFINSVSQGAASSVNTLTSTTLVNGDVVTVNGTTAGCTGISSSLTMIVNIPSAVTVTESAGILTSDAVTGNQWYEQTLGIINLETNQSYTPTANGNYYVIVTDGNGCTTMSNVISFILSVSQNLNANNIKIYPNPANDKVWIEVLNSNNTSVRIEIMSLDGRILFENESTKSGLSKVTVDLNEFASGVYFVKTISGEKSLIQKLVVK